MDQDLITNSNTWKEFKEALEPLNNLEEGRVFEELTDYIFERTFFRQR